MIKRREFVTLVGGAAAWPLAARAQQDGRVRRIGVLMPLDENDPVMKAGVSEFTQALAGLGWTDGRNVRIDLRLAGGDINRISEIQRTPSAADQGHRHAGGQEEMGYRTRQRALWGAPGHPGGEAGTGKGLTSLAVLIFCWTRPPPWSPCQTGSVGGPSW
jgi:hypothetical protein